MGRLYTFLPFSGAGDKAPGVYVHGMHQHVFPSDFPENTACIQTRAWPPRRLVPMPAEAGWVSLLSRGRFARKQGAKRAGMGLDLALMNGGSARTPGRQGKLHRSGCRTPIIF